MELITYLMKRKDFYNKIKILYPLWGVQLNLENQKANITSIHIHLFNWTNKNISLIFGYPGLLHSLTLDLVVHMQLSLGFSKSIAMKQIGSKNHYWS